MKVCEFEYLGHVARWESIESEYVGMSALEYCEKNGLDIKEFWKHYAQHRAMKAKNG